MNRRVYNLLQMMEFDGSLQRMKFFESVESCALIFPEHSKKKEIWDNEQLEGDLPDLTDFPIDDDV